MCIRDRYKDVNIIGSSGGALVAINVAMEAPELVHKVIADSFEGETSLKAFTENVKADREASKHDVEMCIRDRLCTDQFNAIKDHINCQEQIAVIRRDNLRK